jgi:ankyrin repeat protein
LALARSINAMIAAQATQAGDAIPPLIAAIWREDLDAVKRLVDQGADPSAHTGGGAQRPAWMWAIVARDTRATELLLSKVKTVDRAAALQQAANRNDVSLARTLLDKGMPIDAQGFDRSTALLIAAASGHIDVLGLLIERGASVNAPDDFGDTALMAAVRAGSLDAVNALVAARADVNLADKEGRTALVWAVRSQRPDIVDALRAAGARGTATRDISGLPTIRLAVERSLPLIQRGTATWDERQRCTPCHHHPLMFRAVTLAHRGGFAIDSTLFDAQVQRERDVTARVEARSAETLNSEDAILRLSLAFGGDASFGIPWSLSSHAEAALPLRHDNEARVLTKLQLNDGRWRHGPARTPIESSDFTATATAIRTLQAYASPRDPAEFTSHIQRAAAWLRTSTPTTTDDKVFRLYGLNWSAADPSLIRDAVTLLVGEQRPDGGWSQLPGLNSDAYATGMVLVALHEAGNIGVDNPIYQRGVKYLLENQETNGSWLVHKRAVPVNAYFESGFPHGKFQFISYAGTCWATMALVYGASEANR